jgi:hypothetical protein
VFVIWYKIFNDSFSCFEEIVSEVYQWIFEMIRIIFWNKLLFHALAAKFIWKKDTPQTKVKFLFFFFFFFFLGSTGVWTEGCTFAWQALYHLSHSTSPQTKVNLSLHYCCECLQSLNVKLKCMLNILWSQYCCYHPSYKYMYIGSAVSQSRTLWFVISMSSKCPKNQLPHSWWLTCWAVAPPKSPWRFFALWHK